MLLIIIIALLTLLKYLELEFMANVSWWWIIGLMGVAFLWFEFFERMLGLDARSSHEQLDKARKERVKKAFEKK
jgi:small Trp-rich protein